MEQKIYSFLDDKETSDSSFKRRPVPSILVNTIVVNLGFSPGHPSAASIFAVPTGNLAYG